MIHQGTLTATHQNMRLMIKEKTKHSKMKSSLFGSCISFFHRLHFSLGILSRNLCVEFVLWISMYFFITSLLCIAPPAYSSSHTLLSPLHFYCHILMMLIKLFAMIEKEMHFNGTGHGRFEFWIAHSHLPIYAFSCNHSIIFKSICICG